MGIFDKLLMTDEEKEQSRQLNRISYINALNTHNQELQQRLQVAENQNIRNSYNQAIDDAADLLNSVDLPRDELAAAVRELKKEGNVK